MRVLKWSKQTHIMTISENKNCQNSQTRAEQTALELLKFETLPVQ